MNSENSKTSDVRRLKLNLTDKIDLQRGDKRVALSDLGIYYTIKIINKLYNIVEEFVLPDGSYYEPDTQDFQESKKLQLDSNPQPLSS